MTLSITADTSDPTEPPSVRLVAASTTGGPSPIPENTLVEVWRNHEDGSRHRVLTEQGPRLIGGGWASIDPHAPFNQPVTYDIVANGFTATTNTVWLPSDVTWLVHPFDSALSVRVEMVVKIDSRSRKSRAQRFTPIGGKPVFLTDGARDGVTGSITILSTDTGPLVELFADDSVVLLNTPGTAGWDLGWMWIQPDPSYGNPADGVRVPARLVTIPFEESADPDVDLQPVWSSGDAAAAFATSAALLAAYATSLDLVTDTRV